MIGFAVQGFQPNDLPVSSTRSGPSSIHGSNQSAGTSSFSQALERATAKENSTDKQDDNLRPQSAVNDNRTKKEDDQANAAPPVRQDHQADRRADHTEKKEQTDQSSAASTQNASQTADTAANAAAQQANAAQTVGSDETSKSEVAITLSVTVSGDDVKASLEGLPEQLLTALVAACSKETGVTQAVSQAINVDTVNQADRSAFDETGVTALSDGSENVGPLSDGSAKATVKIPTDQADTKNSANRILSMIYALVGALQNNTSGTVDVRQIQIEITDQKTSDPKVSDLLAHVLQKGTPINGAAANQASNTVFRDLIAHASPQNLQATTTVTEGPPGPTVVPDSFSEVKLPKGTDLTEAVLSKAKMVVSLPGVVEATNETAEKETGPSSEGNGNGSFAEQGASVQVNVQHQEQVAGGSTTASFGSIVADRLAAVAEQVGLRDRPLDITLRLKIEGGESLLVGLRDQAGKIIVQVRSADQNMINLLESQKETIVRQLEAKQISSSISVSPIEQDVAKKQGREQPKNGWGRRQQPANQFIEASI
jgi:hypothetical protein